MSVSGINNVAQTNNIQSTKTLEKKTEETSKTSNLTKTTVAIGAGVTALAAVGIYLATKGKGAKSTQETANTIKEMTVDAFKKDGNKFNKGKAVTSTGEAYTGSISHQTKDGKNIVREYENGVLKKSTKYDGENVLSQKEYNYDENGKISEILLPNEKRTTMMRGDNGKLLFLEKPDHSIIGFSYSDEGALKNMSISFDSDNKVADKFVGNFKGDIEKPVSMVVDFDPVTKKPIVGSSRDRSILIDYDKNGNPTRFTHRTKPSGDLGKGDHVHIKDLKAGAELHFTEQIMNKDESKISMLKSTKDSTIMVTKIRTLGHPEPEDMKVYSIKLGFKDKKDGCVLMLDNPKSEIADYFHNGKNIAKYNVKTGDIEMLPDTGVAIDDVKSHINELYSHYNSLEKDYKNTYQRYV